VGKQLDSALLEWLRLKERMANKLQRSCRTHLNRVRFLQRIRYYSQQTKVFYKLMAHYRRRKQRGIYLAKKLSIDRMNRFQWEREMRLTLREWSKIAQHLK
jgi:hypothetical protein